MPQPAVLPHPDHHELRVAGLVGQHPVRALLGEDDTDSGRTRRSQFGNVLAEQLHIPAGPHHHEGSSAGLGPESGEPQSVPATLRAVVPDHDGGVALRPLARPRVTVVRHEDDRHGDLPGQAPGGPAQGELPEPAESVAAEDEQRGDARLGPQNRHGIALDEVFDDREVRGDVAGDEPHLP